MVLLEELIRQEKDVFFRLFYDPVHEIFRAHWLGTLTQEELQLAAHKGLDQLHKYDSVTFLHDHLLCLTNWQDICTWMRVMWTPKNISSSLRYFAHLVSPEQYDGSPVLHDMVHGSVCQLHKDETVAIQWLNNVSNKALV
ncbi:MAG TPA: hypothetical protein DCE41_36765 [Cytophagales bacterium]|nr:hypothetical protein [Cytophagales bacterium]HAA23353.1 hypothetical protein [Cytophagales bacterium]HAP65024.1 hypothetical protein [Cytophagales bacterium]